ncbi:MAG TPA: ADOP family duplicated permease, partial [Bryobacteraceae bacterium]|nr:ADOP family duplicated permease [Bryobacteraceae bacterium]
MNLPDLLLRLRALVLRSRVESELDEEVRFHLEMETRKHRAAGSASTAARRRATIAFGGLERVKEECRDARRTRWLEDFIHDLRFAFRMLRKDRGYTAAAIAALALGIGANTAVFTLFTAVVLKPLPVPDPASVASVWRTTAHAPAGGFFSLPDYVYLRDHNSVFSSLAAETPAHLRLARAPSGTLANNGVAEPILGLFVTANYLSTFGLRPLIGRDLTPDEDRLTAGPYPALLSENYWERRFGRDPAVLNRELFVSGMQTTVVGIMPRDFMGTRQNLPAIWIVSSALGDIQRRSLDRTSLSCGLTAHLKRGVTVQQAQAELAVIADGMRSGYPEAERQWKVTVAPATRFGAGQNPVKRLFGVLQVAMGLVLLIACTNVAGLLLGKAATRQREVAVRLSIGASRGRLVRQFLSEGVLMSFLAGAFAFLVTWQALAMLMRAVSTAVTSEGATIAIDVAPDLHVFFYILGISLIAGISFALLPALRSTRPDLTSALKDEKAGFGFREKGRLRGWMVSGQIAVCLALLIGAGLLTSSSLRLVSMDPGFETRNVLNVTISNPFELGYSAARRQELQAKLDARVRAIPGVLAVSFVSRAPLSGNITTTQVASREQTGGVSGQQFPYSYVSEDYFRTLGIRLLRGRGFTSAEIASSAPVAVISDGLARRLWSQGDAVGKRIALGSPTEVHFVGRVAPVSTATEVIGVAQEVYSSALTAIDPGVVYLPRQSQDWNGLVLIRVAGDSDAIARAIVNEVHILEPVLPVTVETLQHMIATGEASAGYRVGAIVFGVIGLLGFVLAAIGIYSMVAYSASRQAREIGIRMALGAQQSDVMRLLLVSGVKWIAAGLLLGAGLGAILSRLLASQLLLEGPGFLDPAVILAVSLLTGMLA